MNGLLALAYAAGLLSAVNPCGIAMLPGFLTLYTTSGTTEAAPPAVASRLRRGLTVGLALTAGFTAVYATTALLAAGLRTVLGAVPWLAFAIGLTLIGAGVFMLTGSQLSFRLPTPARGPEGKGLKAAAHTVPGTQSHPCHARWRSCFKLPNGTDPMAHLVISAFRCQSVALGDVAKPTLVASVEVQIETPTGPSPSGPRRSTNVCCPSSPTTGRLQGGCGTGPGLGSPMCRESNTSTRSEISAPGTSGSTYRRPARQSSPSRVRQPLRRSLPFSQAAAGGARMTIESCVLPLRRLSITSRPRQQTR